MTTPDVLKLAQDALSPGYFHFSDPALLPQRAEAVREIARAVIRLTEALEPFAQMRGKIAGKIMDKECVYCLVPLDDIDRAARALKG